MDRKAYVGWRVLGILAVGALLAAGAAANSNTVSYQGMLRDATMTPVPDGTYLMAFSIWDDATAGTKHWGDEVHSAVPTKSGMFSVYLGSTQSLGTLFTDYGVLWLEIAADPGSGLEVYAPRVPLASVPYARHAATAINAVNATNAVNAVNAGNADTVDGLHASDLQAIINAVANQLTPIGTIVGWHKNLSGTPALPGTWVQCNGQVINDAGSPYNGQTAPSLNGTGRFLRGSATSGTLQDHQLQDHQHAFTETGANRPPDSGTVFYVQTLPSPGFWYNSTTLNTSNPITGNHGSETRPSNMSVTWIMRIK
ncbi:MAG TPA: hypothetical protein PKI11_12445 [Candidatus Hydrogenedentes bacterium]|nr:hypothetical protein [Candidatus Hydrogenedentota bacterium]HNT88173.1 hypothetical protein [Candidatus Hydrogenedentota bacterium]